MITSELLVSAKLCDKGTADKWMPYLQATAEKFDINTPAREAGFLAQITHESGNFRELEENLNYSADGLLRTFPTHFNKIEVGLYARKPERIANRAYANRMGNGNEESGDGWKYRGRGLIQITGKNAYRGFGVLIGRQDEVLTFPEMVAQPELASLSAGWFWQTNGLNGLADLKDIKAMTRRINGGLNGIDDRTQRYERLSALLL